ncbi:hypothetical protein B0H13DRAFT_2274157 [Mycena leptocephala]|nr:hypothetical protein B0H13DRAFT_2274157 [Mycena leptocephala]
MTQRSLREELRLPKRPETRERQGEGSVGRVGMKPVGETFGPNRFAKIRRDEGVSDATHREVWVNYTCPGGIPCPRAELFSVEVIDGRMRPGDLKLSLRGVSIHGEKMENNGIIPRKQTISAAWSVSKVQTLLPNSKRPEGLNKNFRSYRPSYRGGCCTWNIARLITSSRDPPGAEEIVGMKRKHPLERLASGQSWRIVQHVEEVEGLGGKGRATSEQPARKCGYV